MKNDIGTIYLIPFYPQGVTVALRDGVGDGFTSVLLDTDSEEFSRFEVGERCFPPPNSLEVPPEEWLVE